MESLADETDIAELAAKANLRHVAIIMDGNRRWAKSMGLPSAIGHKKGVEALKNAVYSCKEFRIKYLTVYAFSTENWNRNPEEVEFLMHLLSTTIKNELTELNDNNVVISFLGDLSKLNAKLRAILLDAVETTKNNTGVCLQIAFNYGARAEIVNAVKSISRDVKSGKLGLDDITEDLVSKSLYTSGMPDPDLLIRTGGEVRISNYLLWQIAYSEILILDEFWPEFNRNSMAKAVKAFYKRNRRWGK